MPAELPAAPLISFVLVAYNQERFIREAVEGALAQTYEPLEIILSDDCSPDRTFEIMQQMVADYQGPHKVILNRNEKNLGLGSHFNKVMAIAKGELVVCSAGDDISMPERTARLVQAWQSDPGNIAAIHSAFISIDERGTVIKIEDAEPPHLGSVESVVENLAYIMGATCVYRKDIFKKYGPISSKVLHEDRVMAFRARSLGKIIFLKEPLVKYRINVGVSNFKCQLHDFASYCQKIQKWYGTYLEAYRQIMNDIELHSDSGPGVRNLACAKTREFESRLFSAQGRIGHAVATLSRALMLGGASKGRMAWDALKFAMLYKLPVLRIPYLRFVQKN